MPRLFHAAMTAVAALASLPTRFSGMSEFQRRLLDSPTFAPTVSAFLGVTPYPTTALPEPNTSPVPSSTPSLVPSPSPSSFPSRNPSSMPSVNLRPSSQPSSSPTWQPVVMGKFDWDLTRVDTAEISFSEEFDMGEIMLYYNISKRDYSIQIFEDDCITPVPPEIASASGAFEQTMSRHGNLTVSVDVKQDSVVGSGIWSEGDGGVGYVSVCVRVDLLLDDTGISVHFHEQKLLVTIGLAQGFIVETVGVSRVDAGEEDGDADVDFELIACQCDVQTFECATLLLTQGSNSFICVKSLSEDVVVIGIQSLIFTQGSYSMSSIVDGNPNSLTDVSVINDKVVVRSQLVSAFFEHENPEDVTASGVALLTFADAGVVRFLRANILNHRVLDDKSIDGDAAFSMPLRVESSLQDDSSAVGASLTFTATVVLGGVAFIFA